MDYETEDLVLFDEADEEWHWGGPQPTGTAYALGDVTTHDEALAKAASQINYHDPFDDGSLTVGGDVETWKPFVVESNTLADGTAVDVTILFGYTGTLQAMEGVEGKSSLAEATGQLTLYADNGDVLGASGGNASVQSEWPTGGDLTVTGVASGDWEGNLAEGVDGSGDPVFTLDYDDELLFSAEVGGKYWLYFDLATNADSSAGSGSGWDDSETFARADFSNTGTYQLTSTSDVDFVMVPEPATLSVLAAGGLLVLRRRRTA
ncbi:MAG: PEP-CTERM sorting domain-containing protein [Planctomycetota bacterium]